MSFNLVKLGDICRIGSSKRIKRADYVQDGIPFFRSKEVIELSKGNSITTELFISKGQFNQINEKFGSPDTGDILITSVGTLGVAYHVEQSQLPFYFKDGNLTWLSQFSEDVNPRWVFYWLNSPEGQRKIDEISIGSTQRAITIVALKSIEFQLPHKDEQDRTVKILDSVTKKISTNDKTNQTLEQIAQAIFKSWFVDFDPVKAKIETLAAGGSDDDAELAAMSVISAKTVDELNSLKASNPEAFNTLAQTAALFPDAMQDSELGEIPEGWEVKFLGEISTFLNGFAFKSKELTTDAASATHKVFKMGNIRKGGGFNSKGSKDYFDLNSNPKLNRFLIKKGDLLMSMTDMKNNVALLGHTALMPSSDEYLVNQRVGLIRKSDSHYLDFPFLYYQTNETSFITSVRSRANSGVQVNLSTEGIKETPLVVPPRKVHTAFDKQVRALLEMIFTNEKQSVELENVRDLLLPKLLSGEINVTSEVVE